jgi:hypothetical protein
MALTLPKFQQDGTGAVNRDVGDKLKEFVSVKDFGAVGDGVADDTVAIDLAEDFCYTNKKMLDFENCRLKITQPITLRCAFRFDKASYADLSADANDRPGFIPVGLSASAFAVTVETRLGSVANLSVLGDTTSRVNCRGVLFNNVQRCQVNLVTVSGLNGCGIEVRECWDSTFTALATLKCGNSTDYAIQITDGMGSTNECVFNHLQTEIGQVKGLYVSPNTYNCTFNVIHAEQVAGNGTDYTHDIRGGRGCVFNSVRCTGTNVRARVGCASGVYNGIGIEDDTGSSALLEVSYGAAGTQTLNNVYLEGNLAIPFANLSEVTINRIGMTGVVYIDQPAQYVSGVYTQPRVKLVDPTILGHISLESNWSAVIIDGGNIAGFTAAPGSFGGRVFCKNATVTGNVTLSNALFKLDNVLFAGTVTTSQDGLYQLNDCAFVGLVTISGTAAKWMTQNCDYQGGISRPGGNESWRFGVNDRVTGGSVTPSLLAAPSGSASFAAGERSYNITPAVGQPKAWVCTVAGTPGTWVSEGNL